MPLKFLEWLRLVQQESDLLGRECLGPQQVAQTLWHDSSNVTPRRHRSRENRFKRSAQPLPTSFTTHLPLMYGRFKARSTLHTGHLRPCTSWPTEKGSPALFHVLHQHHPL